MSKTQTCDFCESAPTEQNSKEDIRKCHICEANVCCQCVPLKNTLMDSYPECPDCVKRRIAKICKMCRKENRKMIDCCQTCGQKGCYEYEYGSYVENRDANIYSKYCINNYDIGKMCKSCFNIAIKKGNYCIECFQDLRNIFSYHKTCFKCIKNMKTQYYYIHPS